MYYSPRFTPFLIATLIATVFLLLPPFSKSQSDSDRKLYNDPVLFEQLSSSGQNLLRLRLGLAHAPHSSITRLQKKEERKFVFQQSSPSSNLLSALANVLVNNAAADATAQDTQSETSILLAGSIILAGFNDSGSYLGGASHFTGFSRSTDGGATWVDGGTLPASANGDAGDPVLARNNTTGRIYFATLQFNNNGMAMFRSDNNGATWMAPTQAAPGATGFQDKEWIAVDNFAGSGQGNVYHAYRDFEVGGGIRFTRSIDNGATFLPSPGLMIKAAAINVQGAYVVVGPDHSVYVFWYDQDFTPRQIQMRKSTDQGVTFAAALTVATLLGTSTNGDLALGGGFRSNSFPSIDVNPVSGNLYVVFNDNPAGVDKSDIYLVQSTDGGTTWSTSTRVNGDATTNDQWQPAIAVRPDGTGLAVGWYDRRTDAANSLIERWSVTAAISGSTITFNPNFKISPPFGVVVGADPVVNTTYMGDYDQMGADNNFYYTLWGDNRDQSIVAVPSRKNANVRFAKFPQAGPGPVAEYVSRAITGGNGNGLVDPNECNNISVSIRNSGTGTATGVSAILSTTTPNVTVVDASSNYPDMSVGATAANITAFRINTSPSFTCGTTVALQLVVTYSGGNDTLSFSVSSGIAGAPVQFDNNTPTSIPDNNPIGVEIPITVSGISSAIGKVTASLYLTHSYDSDLLIKLISPDNTIVTLSNRRGGGGDNFGSTCSSQSSRTTFDDAAATAISAGTAPFIGSFRPDTPLSQFNGKSGAAVNGTWKLLVSDLAPPDIGTVQCWSLFISPAVCTDGGGSCAPVPIQLSSFSGRTLINNNVVLDWTTASEVNNYGFEIQKSQQAEGVFTTIAGSFIPGHGTTLVPQHYRYTDANASADTRYYRLRQIDLDGSINYSDPVYVSTLTEVGEKEVPSVFSLAQNYPNPFNPSTTIKYGLPKNAHVTLEVFNTLGQRVAVLVDEMQEAGYYHSNLDGQSLASGVYVYKLTAGSFVESKKLVLLK